MKVKVCIADVEKYSEVVCHSTNCKWNMMRIQSGPHCAIKQVCIGKDGECVLMQPAELPKPPKGQTWRTGGK